MCLKLKFLHRKHTARKDIVVFKGLRKNWHAVGRLETPYQGQTVVIGESYESELTKVNEYLNSSKKSIRKGIHTFKYLDECIKADNYDVICKCIIPKGSHYYKGLFEKYDSYASDRLTYIRILQNNA